MPRECLSWVPKTWAHLLVHGGKIWKEPIVGASNPQTILADGYHKEMYIGYDYDGSKT